MLECLCLCVCVHTCVCLSVPAGMRVCEQSGVYFVYIVCVSLLGGEKVDFQFYFCTFLTITIVVGSLGEFYLSSDNLQRPLIFVLDSFLSQQ